ncbi:MAG: amidase family protein, partial [Steroidobacteraceae bacterium]
MSTSRRLSSVLLLTSAMALAGMALAAPQPKSRASMDRELLEVTIPQLQRFYAQHKYTVTEVVQWHLARIHRYNGIYRAIESVMATEALAAAAQEDAQAAQGHVRRGLLWGVPVVIKANTSIAG